jgi:hypothetical protein
MLGYNKGVGCYPIIWGVKLSNRKIKIERRTGPWVYMAATGGGDTTTNQKLASAMGYSWGRRCAGQSRWGETLSHCLGHRIEQRKN